MVNNIIVVSDLHCGCTLGLCPPGEFRLDMGTYHKPSDLQLKVWALWEEFWNEWVPKVTKGESYDLVVNGDPIEGQPYGAKTPISINVNDQRRLAMKVLNPIVAKCRKLYMIRGTESHEGKSSEDAEGLAEDLGAMPNKIGQFARNELRYVFKCPDNDERVVHFLHHIGVTSRQHYETSAPMGELGEMFIDAARWRKAAVDIVVRAHRHRATEVRIPTANGYGIVFITPGWQLKTPFTFKVAGGRVTTPQFGGSLIRLGDQDLYTRHKIWDIETTEEVTNE